MNGKDQDSNVQTVTTLALVPRGEKVSQHMSAVSTINLAVGPEALVNVAKTQLRVRLDQAIAGQVKDVKAKTATVDTASKAASAYQAVPPDSFVNNVQNLANALKPFYPDAFPRVDNANVANNNNGEYVHTGKVVEYSGRNARDLLVVSVSIPLPDEAKQLFADLATATTAMIEADAELKRLRTERGRLNELAEEAAAALTTAQLSRVDGGQDYLDALNKANDIIGTRLSLPAPAPEDTLPAS